MFNKTKIALSAVMLLGTLGTASVAWAGGQNDADSGAGGFVIPGSTVGVNPAHHPDLLGNGAKAYGFAGSVSQTRRPAHDRR